MTVYDLYYVTGRDLLPAGHDFITNLDEACRGGATIVQLREKQTKSGEFLELAQKAKAVCDKHGVPLIINDRLDIALAVGAGLHVGQQDLPAKIARELLGPDKLLGVSVNTEEEMRIVMQDKVADYVGIGPAYNTSTKKDLSPVLGTRGVSKILKVLGDSPIKAVVIGGVSLETVPNVLRQCAARLDDGSYRQIDGVAVVSALAASTDPRKSAEALRSIYATGPSYPIKPHSASTSTKGFINAACTLLERLRGEDSPLVHNITNQVVPNDCANLTLALGASPIMSGQAEEADELGAMVGALVINFGTISPPQLAAMRRAGMAANRNGRPIIYDPVGVGATSFRRTEADKLLSDVHMSIVKGNAGEIGAILGSDEVKARGVDSVGKGFKDPASVVKALAQREKLVVAMSGVKDYITDGVTAVEVSNGHELQSVITGSGCMASTAVACFASVADDFGPFVAAVAGVLAYNIAAEIAAERPDVKGPNTFRSALIDSCYHLTSDDITKRAKLALS